MTDERSKVEEHPPEEPKASAEKEFSPELKEAQERYDDLLNRMKYLQAEFENYRKRASRDTEALIKFANEALILRLLPVLDDFDAALAHLDGESSKGVQMVHDNLLAALGAAGLQEIPADGEKFDPYVHDCLQQVPDADLEDGVVREIVRKGYRLQDRVLRPAQVIVVKNRGETHG